MGATELKELQEETGKIVTAIFTRTTHYVEATKKIRELFTNYFFLEQVNQYLQESSEAFDFNRDKGCLQHCLMDESLLKSKAESIQTGATPKLTEALDANVRESSLPFIFNIKESSYHFSPTVPYTPKQQRYLMEFAHALTIYRLCLNICDSYIQIVTQASLAQHEKLLQDITALKEQRSDPKNPMSLTSLWGNGKYLKRTATQLTTQINNHTEEAQTTIQRETPKLVRLFAEGSQLLQKSYTEFENTATLSWVLSDPWRKLSTTVAGLLYKKYTYTDYYMTLTIKDDNAEQKKELEDYQEMIAHQFMPLKKELLLEAFNQINQIISGIKIEATCKGIELQETSKQTFFSQNSYYQGMLYMLSSHNPGTGMKSEVF